MLKPAIIKTCKNQNLLKLKPAKTCKNAEIGQNMSKLKLVH